MNNPYEPHNCSSPPSTSTIGDEPLDEWFNRMRPVLERQLRALKPRRWYHRLVPEITFLAGDEYNAADLHIYWLCFHLHTLDEPEVGLNLDINAGGILAWVSLPYIRLRLEINFPAAIYYFVYNRLSRYPRKT